MKTRLLSSVLVTLLGSLGCAPLDDGSSSGGSDSESTNEKAGNNNHYGGPGGGGGASDAGVEITAFARDLILHHTANHTEPTTTEDKQLIDVSPVTFGRGFFHR